VTALVGFREPNAVDEQGDGAVISGCARRTDAMAVAAWVDGERLHEKVGEAPNPVTAAVSEAVPVASTTVRPPMDWI